MLLMGVDIGSTHTDAVVVNEEGKLFYAAKAVTTRDVTSGVLRAMELVMSQGPNPAEIGAVMFGTTHGLNAIIERRRLAKVAVIRIGLPATRAIEPMLDWPPELKEAVNGGIYVIAGGYEYTGEAISDLDESLVRNIAREIRVRGVRHVAITSVFSPVNPEHENRVREILMNENSNLSVTVSHEVGTLGLLERENSTILNSSIMPVIKEAIESVSRAMRDLGLEAPLYLTQNDGTVMSSEHALKYPIFTVATGASNAIRGAFVLTGIRDAVVCDTGGTTTNVGVLVKGFPRESSQEVVVGGVRTNFRMPDIVSVGCAGGSMVKIVDNRVVDVGPESVGYRLIEMGVAWGGDTLTATDVALALGKMKIEDGSVDPSRVSKLYKDYLEQAYTLIVQKIEDAIDRIKTSAEPTPVILVGGGSLMLPKKLTGASMVYRPEGAQYANAIGAATAFIGAVVDKAYSYEHVNRKDALADIEREARNRAVLAGADPATVEVVDVEEIAMPYLPGNAVRIRVKAVGRLGRRPKV
ncbi:MAG: hydantoinase/oxoprolinase family protein [Nitrososphaerota archaeon]